MLMHRLHLTGVVAVLVLAVAATVLAVKKPSEADRSMRDDSAANVEASSEVNDEATVAGGATSCESIGGAFEGFSFGSIYRGNELRFDSEGTLLSFCMELSFAGTTDLYFSIHRRVSDNSFERLAGVPDVILLDAVGTGQAQFYCTDQADVPPGSIPLRPADYVFGVTWGNRTSVTFFRDSFDPSFAVGRVEGAIGLNGVSPPLEDPLLLLPADGRFAHSMEICLAPEPGACCSKRFAGNCQELFENGEDGLGGCTGAGEFFHGQRSRCEETICRFGACCKECQACNEDYAKEACRSPGDVWHLNTDCPAGDDERKELCPGITGACCDGTVCKDLCIDDCDDLDGTYFGDGSVCEINQCTGACLTCESGECRQRSEFTCETFLQGEYKGAGTSCVRPEPQDECGGSCCFYDGGTGDPICINVDLREDCIAQKGQSDVLVFLGDGQDGLDPVCESTTSCPSDADDRFACCLPEGDCIDVLSTDTCDAMFGEPNTSLKCSQASFDCRDLRVACCFADGNCELLMRDSCTASGGHSSGGIVCDPDPCADSGIPEVTGVCCGTDRGVCDVTTELVCLDRGEFFLGTQTDDCGIAEETCPGLGACCRENGECFDDVTPDECSLILDGTYIADGSRCSDTELTCSDRGACCTIFGSCVLATDGECSAIDGVFEGVGEACASDTCDSGACCLDDGRCEPRRSDRCVDLDRFAGNGTACPDGVCTQGACCLIDGNCLQDEAAFACTGNKLFTAESTCEELDPPCEGQTPCCFRDGSCESLRPEECETANGAPQRGVAECSTGLCTAGACCSPEHECADEAFALSCVAQADHTFHEGESCAFNRPCDPVGVCCVEGVCSVITEFECSRQFGVFNGDLLDCSGDSPCALGACCREILPDVIACSDAFQRLECADPTDVFHEGVSCSEFPCDEMGACCVDDGCTDDRPKTLCEEDNGRFAGLDTACEDGVCTAGACCLLSGTCLQDEPAFACTGDNQFAAGSTCAELDPSCEAEQPCCFVDESCDFERPADCVAAGGVPQIGAGECTTGLCETGACCVIGTCTDDQTQTLCDNALGRFAGTDTTCAGDVCTQGACCLVNGVCLRDEPAFACTGDNLFTAGSSCEELDPSCEAVTPCCLLDEFCDLLRPADCEAAGGIPQTGAADCTTGLCATGACCVDGNCTDDQTQTLCENANGRFPGEGSECDVSCGACGPDQILGSDPPNCAIDARFPHAPGDPESRFGFNGVELTFDCDPANLTINDFLVTVHPPGPVVTITAVVPIDSTRVWLPFSEPTLTKRWTCVEYIDSGEQTCVGSLPADVNGSRAVTAEDLILLVDFLGDAVGPPPLDPWQCDIDRSDSCSHPDILAEIDLLLGVGFFTIWDEAIMPACPSAP